MRTMKRLLFAHILILNSIASFSFSGIGAGTEKSPYLITNCDELFEIRSDLSAHYKLVNDIDLGTWLEENSPQYGWSPIGTASSPFSGVFDGNNNCILNLKINRESSNDLGLFGYVVSATIKNLVIINPQIIGNDNVGTILGQRYADSRYDEAGPGALLISNCYVIGGSIQGNNCIGGIIGYDYCGGHAGALTIEKCHNSANITGTSKIGGICGSMNGNASPGLYIRDCFSIGDVTGTSMVGGIAGHCETVYSWITKYDCGRPDLVCERTYVRGNIKGIDTTCGIAGYAYAHGWTPGSWGSPTVTGAYTMSSNVCLADTIQGDFRICQSVSSQDNYASTSTVLLLQNGIADEVEDNEFNGTSMGTRLLQKSATYEGLGWDFSNIWMDLSLHDEFPVLKNQSSEPSVTTFEAKSKGIIKGTTPYSNGTVYVIIDKVLYSSPIEDGKWEITLGRLSAGTKAIIFSNETEKIPSSIVKAFAKEVIEEPTIITGDANGDGALDAADVVSIVNYILGKPSPSFNEKNADANGDGQILVDDAVGTVNLIINNQ